MYSIRRERLVPQGHYIDVVVPQFLRETYSLEKLIYKVSNRVSQSFKRIEFLDIELHTAVYVPKKQSKKFSGVFRLFSGVAITFNIIKGSC